MRLIRGKSVVAGGRQRVQRELIGRPAGIKLPKSLLLKFGV
jgi:hypothetical protein